MIRVGVAGWSYPDWEGVVYPRPRGAGFHPLRYLARFIDCVEVNSTFYSVPRPEVAAGWERALEGAPELRLTAKLHRDFTHRERADSREELERDARSFLDALEPIWRPRRLSALLVQFPIGFRHGPAEVRWLGHLHGLFGRIPLVLEVRHASWFTPPGLAAVGGLGFSLAHIDLPPAWDHPPPWHEPTGPIGYLRAHGRNARAWFDPQSDRDAKYDHLYSDKEIEELILRARRVAAVHDQTFVVMNNHFSGKALANALEILAALRGRPAVAPPQIVRAFPGLAKCTRPEGQQELF